MITITCGVNSYPTEKVTGWKVSQIRDKFKDVLSIPAGARCIVNGRQVGNDETVVDGAEVEFVKETGEKG